MVPKLFILNLILRELLGIMNKKEEIYLNYNFKRRKSGKKINKMKLLKELGKFFWLIS